jgi:CRP/FNR family transcriptional regulator, anaerobic regulatory protein
VTLEKINPIDVGFERLRAYFADRAAFTEDEFAFLQTLFLPRTLPVGEFLQRAGDVATHAAFVATGCLRSYVIDAKGKEHIVQFAPEDWWLADTTSLMSGTPSQYFIDAVETSSVLLMDPASHQRALARVPGYAASFQTGLQRHAAAKDQRIVNSLTSSAEERYEEFIRTYPSIALRVPQWMLASYLGVSPETLSRVRKSRSRK